MKISNSLNPTANTGIQKSKNDNTDLASSLGINQESKGASAADIASAARVELSQAAKDISRVTALATPDDGIDEAKVARLQKLIDDGNYRIDAEGIADRLVDEHLKMS